MKSIVLFLCLASFSVFAQAGPPNSTPPSPIGVWETSDKKGDPIFLVEIKKQKNGILLGRIVEVLTSKLGPNPMCGACPTERHNKPLLGMKVLWGAEQLKSGEWAGGTLLNTRNGDMYSVKLRPSLDGTTMEVRWFVGAPIFGRTQVWVRKANTLSKD